LFVNFLASSSYIPLINSVANELLAIADPQPKVLKHVSSIYLLPLILTLIYSFITSPQAGAPTIAIKFYERIKI
jgi:hypothetical protein